MATQMVEDSGPRAHSAQTRPEAVVVRFAGDSGDGMQLTGGQFTLSTALARTGRRWSARVPVGVGVGSAT